MFADENFRDLKVKVYEIIFAVFIFAISNEPTFELGDRIKRWLWQTTVIPACSQHRCWLKTMIMTDDGDSCT